MAQTQNVHNKSNIMYLQKRWWLLGSAPDSPNCGARANGDSVGWLRHSISPRANNFKLWRHQKFFQTLIFVYLDNRIRFSKESVYLCSSDKTL